MENSRIKEAMSAISQSLGIDLEVIVNDAQLEPQQKFRLIYEKVLTALLTKWMKNDEKGELGLPPDFCVKDFVAGQLGALPVAGEAMATGRTMQDIPNLLLMPKLVEEVKRAKGKEVDVVVTKLFDLSTAVLQNDRFDLEDLANITVKLGLFAISLAGGVAAIATLATLTGASSGALVIAAVAGATVAGGAIIGSFLAFIYSLYTSGILLDRSFFGVVLNDTDKDLSIPDWKSDSNAKSRYSGIYCRNGWLSGLMVDNYNGAQVAVIGKRENVETEDIESGKTKIEHYCYCGLYLLEKKGLSDGSEGIFRFKIDNVKFDQSATCPLASHNRMYTSFNHTDETMYAAESHVANEWKKKKEDELLYGKATKEGICVTYSLNKLTNSPAYGITTVE